MPRRFIQFEEDYYYHTYNRGVNKQPIFTSRRDFSRAIETIKFYLPINTPIRYSKFLQFDINQRSKLIREMSEANKRCEIIAFCLMPNHFHFLLKESSEDGIKNFIRNFEISYTKYFNIKYSRTGPLLQGQFKALEIEDDSQLLHLSRYIHLNPTTSNLINPENLLNYEWSSFPEYINQKSGICEKSIILNSFKSVEKYKNSVLSRADYQRKLKQIKHLLIEK